MNWDMMNGLVRHILTAVGFYFVAEGDLEESQVEVLVGAVMTLVGFAWSMWVKRSK